jgi:thioredoxin 1
MQVGERQRNSPEARCVYYCCGGNMTEVKYVTENDFQTEVLNEEKPVLVDFTAAWCQPCKMVDPIVKQLAQDWDGKVKVVKLDADQNPNIMMQYGVLGIPTLMLFRGGQVQERLTGYQPKDKLVSKLDPHLSSS